MCYKTSPAKLLRNVKRMAFFNEKTKEKSIQKKLEPLTVTIFPAVNIMPRVNPLTFSKSITTNILPKKTLPQLHLTNVNICSTDIPPDPLPCFYCNLVCPKPNLPPTPTRPIQLFSVCCKPIREDVEPVFCCNLVMHNLCWGDHECYN